jgi:Bbp16-like protein
MLVDQDLLFSNSQALTATAVSTNLIDLAPLGVPFNGGTNLGRAIGYGEELYIFVSVEVAMTDAGSDTTVTVDLQTDDSAGFGSPTTVATLGVIPAIQAAGTRFFFRMPIGVGNPLTGVLPYERFIRLNYTMTNGNLSTGTFSAGIVKDTDTQMPLISYASGMPANAAG